MHEILEVWLSWNDKATASLFGIPRSAPVPQLPLKFFDCTQPRLRGRTEAEVDLQDYAPTLVQVQSFARSTQVALEQLAYASSVRLKEERAQLALGWNGATQDEHITAEDLFGDD